MNKTQIHFAHANGFPASSYQKLFTALEQDYDIGFIDCHGHTSEFPVTDNWEYLIQELVCELKQNYTSPVIGLGHSFGGVLTWLAARRNPELFKAVVVLDPPLLTAMDMVFIRLVKRLGIIDRITPSGRTKVRKTEWSTAVEAEEYFRSKSLFKGFDPDCLSDYVAHGMMHGNASLRLKFEREVEAAIFATVPHSFGKAAEDFKALPVAMIHGSDSDVMTRHRVLYHRIANGFITRPFEGGHLFPFQKPDAAADSIRETIAVLTGERDGPQGH
ncbi:alpha/beta hydrolase [Endozoicomonas sp. OPT23]|uniref:alpha/beta fold hydrolase n=1 Tax=Endozoicomonas sp. OPT23 TaxID=2072845 RepID=UPI00129B99D6|nr:alpha/beta hydrolase [Endozoicomonas sp. OPT23]MRI34384.1 alpha/beta hydrolase [Endozoicomonas sp. OPT23]